MGQPLGSDPETPAQAGGQTRGTETSKYPEEKKERSMAQVVASERAAAQTLSVATHAGGCRAVESDLMTGEPSPSGKVDRRG